jgi:hypothetical protein
MSLNIIIIAFSFTDRLRLGQAKGGFVFNKYATITAKSAGHPSQAQKCVPSRNDNIPRLQSWQRYLCIMKTPEY